MDTGAVLRTTELFSGLDDDAAEQLAKLLVPRQFRRGQPLFHQGDPGNALFVVVDGTVVVYMTSEDGDRMVLTTLGPTDVLGEIALLDEGTRSASAEAVEPTTALALSRTAFLDVVRDHPGLVDALLRSMGALVRRLSEQASDFVFLDLTGRVAKAILRLADDSGGDPPFELSVTQSRLAEMAGGSRQSVNQILQNLAARGMLEVQARGILLTDPNLLRPRAGLTG